MRSIEYLEAAEAASHALREQYDSPATYRNNSQIAALHQSIGFALKNAEVHATLAVAEHLGDLAVLRR